MLGFVQRWRKYSKLHALSRRQRQRASRVMTVEGLLDGSSDRDLEELCSIVLGDKDCLAVLSGNNGSAETLRELFHELCRGGAGQWAENLYVPYVALAEPWMLEYLLRRRSRIRRYSRNRVPRCGNSARPVLNCSDVTWSPCSAACRMASVMASAWAGVRSASVNERAMACVSNTGSGYHGEGAKRGRGL